MFVVLIESGDAQTLLLIQKYIAFESIIYANCWKAYGQIDPIYQHKTMNHSQYFVDPDKGVYTQNIELWRDIRGIIFQYDRK